MTIVFKGVYILISFVVGYRVNLVLHEIGHAIFGEITGYKWVTISTQRFVLERKKKSIRRKKMKGSYWYAFSAPKDICKKNNPLFYFAGGILVNLIVCIISYIAMIYYGKKECVFLENQCSVMCVTAFIMIVMNSLPIMSDSTHAGDGLMIKHILADKAVRDNYKYVTYIEYNLFNGIKIQDIDIMYDIKKIKFKEYNMVNFVLLYYAAYKALAIGDFENADILYDELLYNVIEYNIGDKEIIICDKLWIAYVNGDMEGVNTLLDDEIKKYVQKNYNRSASALRIKYMLEIIDGVKIDYSIYEQCYEEMINEDEGIVFEGTVLTEKDILGQVRNAV